MKFLECLICDGELDIIAESGYVKSVKCKKCNNSPNAEKKETEVLIIKRR